MKAYRLPIDSEVLGANVLSIDEFDRTADFGAFERAYVEEHEPRYVSCKVPLESVADVHRLEDLGFRVVECQIKSEIDLRTPFEIPSSPFRFARVTTEEELAGVLEIAGTAFTNDRFSIDPEIDPSVSGERYKRYTRQSFEADNEAVYRLFDPESNRAVAFKTHRYLDNGEVLLLLGGVHPSYTRLGVGVINTYAELAELRSSGIRRGHTHISAVNYPIFNLEIGKLGYRIVKTFAVLRKIY